MWQTELYGVINDENRVAIWSALLGVKSRYDPTKGTDSPDHAIIARDMRSAIAQRFDEPEREASVEKLEAILNTLFRENPDMRYYQGLHEIGAVLLLISRDDSLAYAWLHSLSRTHLCECRLHELNELVMRLLDRVDAQLAAFLIRSKIPLTFSLRWIVCWFARDIDDAFPLQQIARLFDYFIASGGPLAVVYVAVALLVSHKQEIMSQECAITLYAYLVALIETTGPEKLDVGALIANAERITNLVPPIRLTESYSYVIRLIESPYAPLVLAGAILSLGVAYIYYAKGPAH